MGLPNSKVQFLSSILIMVFQVVVKRILSAKARYMGDPDFKEKMKKQPELLLELFAHN